MFRKPAERLGTLVLGGGALVLIDAKRIADFFALVGIPKAVGDALVTISHTAGAFVYAMLLFGVICTFFLIYDEFIRPYPRGAVHLSMKRLIVPPWLHITLGLAGIFLAMGVTAWGIVRASAPVAVQEGLTLDSAANVSSPPRLQLSPGDQRFREALRSFAISNLNDVLQNAASVFTYLQHIDRTKNEGQPEQKARDHFIQFAISANDFHYSNIKELAKPEVEDIDADQLQNLIYDFFQAYQLSQKHIGSLNGVLKVNLLATEPMQRLVEADKQCRIELRKLNASPQANRLKEIPESIFASSEDRIWSRAP